MPIGPPDAMVSLRGRTLTDRYRLETMPTPPRAFAGGMSIAAACRMDLSTEYLGLELRSPVVASPSPLSATISGVKELADAGIGAIVLYSLFEEQLTLSKQELTRFLADGSGYAETLATISESPRLQMSPLDYLRHLDRAKGAVDVPIIASLNGSPHLRYAHYAKLLQQAGADAIELNLYYVTTDFDESGASVEERYIETVRTVVSEVTIPVAVKMSPYFSNIANMSKRIVEAGAQGLVLFNRFYQPDLDIRRRSVHTTLDLSEPSDLRLPLRWISILHGRVEADLAVTTGVHTAEEVLKAIFAGASIAMVCATLLKNGVGRVDTIHDALRVWMASENVNRLAGLQGLMSRGQYKDSGAFERAQYIRTLETA